MVEILNFNLPVRKESMMKKIKIIAIVGKSGSGKDYWLRKICDNDEDFKNAANMAIIARHSLTTFELKK